MEMLMKGKSFIWGETLNQKITFALCSNIADMLVVMVLYAFQRLKIMWKYFQII